MLSQVEADALVAEDKVISANLQWRPIASRGSRYVLEVAVLASARNLLLKLSARVGKRNFSFALLYGNDPIRKLTKHAAHHNPDCTWIRQVHKHRWDDVHEDGLAYIPMDIDTSDVDRALLGFLEECNIRLLGNYAALLGL